MSAPLIRIGSAGAVIDSRSPTLHLLGATTLPGGGQYCVDLLRPDQPYSIVLTASQFAETEPRAFALAFAEALELGTMLPTPPEAWWRLALVAGIDRWFPDLLDEGLLAADRGLARVEADRSTTEPAESFVAAVDSLTALVDRLRTRDEEDPEPSPPPVRAELLRILRAGSEFVPELAPLLEDAQLLRASRGAAATPEVRRTSELPTKLITPPAAQLDPLRLPARLLRGPLHIEPAGPGLWRVRCTTFPAIDADHPASGRLFIRALDARTGDLLALGQWVLDVARGEFMTILQLPRAGLDDVVIEPYDSWSSGAPRITPDERVRVKLLEQAQFAFSLIRDATALLGLGARDDARATLVFASVLAGGLPAAESGHLARIDSVVAGPRLDLSPLMGAGPSARPLLCELARAIRAV